MYALYVALFFSGSVREPGIVLAHEIGTSTAIVEVRVISVDSDPLCTVSAEPLRSFKGVLPKKPIEFQECGGNNVESRRGPREDIPRLKVGEHEILFQHRNQVWFSLREVYWDNNANFSFPSRREELLTVAACHVQEDPRRSAECLARGMLDTRRNVRVAAYVIAVGNHKLPGAVLAPAYVSVAEGEKGSWAEEAAGKARAIIRSDVSIPDTYKQDLERRLNRIHTRKP